MEQNQNELTVIEPKNLSVNITDGALTSLTEQRKQLSQFVTSQLKQGINGDYAQIPGTPKKSLLKPGAEKLANLFKLGSRIVDKTREIDHEKGFALFSYTIEVFHIPTGTVISQCEGSANSEEKKNKGRPMADLLNTLGKMAQKRAFVGAIIMACGASDFFTGDLEDTNLASKGQDKAASIQAQVSGEMRQSATEPLTCKRCGTVMRLTKAGNAWSCPNYADKSQGSHDYLPI